MTCFGQHQLTYTGQKQWLFQDNPCAEPGVLASTQLPEAVQLLHAQSSDQKAALTFIFKAQPSGLKCMCLWDTGAAKSFISSNFVAQHGLNIRSSDKSTIVLADGSTKDTLGTCKVKLQVQKHCSEVILNVTDLVSGFNVILENDWSQQHCVEAKFGGLEFWGSHLHMRSTKTRIYPLRPTLFSQGDAVSAVLVPNLLSAVQVKRLLKKGTTRGCESPFMVIVREQRQPPSPGDQDKIAMRSKSLDALLKEYSNVFEAPRFGASQNAVRECIELEPEARPPNRPAFRFSMPQRQEVEKKGC
jgi:hypothetical protein